MTIVTNLQIPALDGQLFDAYAARPELSSAPCIIVIQEIFGVNAAMRAICDDLARQGYWAICPDLFWRQQRNVQLTDQSEAEWQEAFRLYNGFDVELGLSDLIAALAYVRKMPGCNGAVGTVGYCLGGKLAFLFIARSDIDCAAGYYGVGLEECLREVNDIRRPLLLHIAGQDQFVPPEAREKIMRGIGKNPQITAALYPEADHAFARPGGKHYDEAAASEANKRSADFFAAHLKR